MRLREKESSFEGKEVEEKRGGLKQEIRVTSGKRKETTVRNEKRENAQERDREKCMNEGLLYGREQENRRDMQRRHHHVVPVRQSKCQDWK